MTTHLQVVTIGFMAVGVILTRLLPFLFFPSKERTPHFVRFLGKYLASAVFGMLIVYCLKDISLLNGNHGIPQIIGILACVLLHLWRKNMLITIAGGTFVYMLILRYLF